MRIFHNKIISKAICGGVEIGTVEFQPKGRMENTHRVIYESQTFIPFIEECMLPTNQQLSRNIYLEKCDDAATALTQLMKNETSEKVAIINYSNTVPIQSQLLLSTLKNILDGVQHKDKHLEHEFKNYLINIQDDFLVRTFLSNTTFKKVFDIIEENCFSSTIHVFEINSHYNPLSAQLSAILRKMNSKRWQFTILPDFSSLISSNSSNNEFAENETTNSETIAESVLICSFYSGSFSDLQTFVSVLSNLRNKFILVIYRSKVPNAEKVLRTFFKMSKDEHSATVFEQMLEQSNMCTIARKSDSHGMHLYLLRKCTNIDNPLIYDLAKDNCDHLKIYITDNFKNRTEKSPPLWILIDNKSINNIEDFFREFRKEDVKFIYVEDGIFEEQQLNTTNFKYDDVLKKNLVTSVFKNGQWGSFYHELLENDPDSVAPVCEFSGRNQKAKRNCGIAKQCLSSMVQVYKNIAWPVPTDLTSNEAFILSYFISYYGLIWKGKLKEKQSILISGGASNVGQAAIHIALSMNCEIFTTVGVDMIFSSFSGNQLMAAFDCLASNGKLIHYGKLDASINDVLDICVLSNNASIISINPISIFENQCQHSLEEKISEKIHGLILDGVSNGVVKPLRATLSNREKMGNITKLSENEDVVGQNITKEEKVADVIPPQPQRNLVSPVTFFYAMKNYIIIDGLTTFGMLLGDWLVKRGVKKLTISTQKILNDGERQHFPEAWKHFGIEVTVRNLTSSNSNEVSQLLRDAKKDGPVGGIFVLISENSQVEDTIKNLDSESRSLCGSLDWFTCFSPSLGCKNYARNVCRNAIIERVCEQRCKDHLNGTIIHWDVIEGEDVVDWSSESIVPTPLQRQLMNLFLVELQNILEMNKRVICCRFLQNN